MINNHKQFQIHKYQTIHKSTQFTLIIKINQILDN